ncbi:EamA family transporter [Roseibium salinum]|uniref:EamA family transporter n=1 Tax=Roseibium salinum TaxID=1604349 RepID=UPI003609E6AD
MVLGAVVFRERLHAATFVWIALALAGLVLATGLTGADLTADGFYLTGILFTLAAAFLYALVTIIAKGLSGINAPQLTLVQCLCGTLLLAGVTPLAPQDLTSSQWGWLALIGMVHTGGVYMLLYGALPKLTTPLIAVLLFLYPASAVIVDAVAYGHILGPRQFAGLAFIIVASLGVTLKWGMRPALAAPAP